MKPVALTLCIAIFAPAGLCAETVDRVVASIGSIAITQSEIELENRFERFIDGQPQSPAPDAQSLDHARDRLIKQTLLALEAEAEGIDVSGLDQEAARLLEQTRKLYAEERSYQSALSSTSLTEDQALRRLERHVRSLRLIDQRLRPNAWVERSQVEAYYREAFVPEHGWRDGTAPPPLEEVENQIREILLQQKVDQLLEEWLQEIEGIRRVELHSF